MICSRPVCMLYLMVTALVLCPGVPWAFSDETLAEKDKVDVITAEDLGGLADQKPGLFPKLTISGNFSWVDNRSVVGTIDGSNLNLGYIVAGQLVHLSDNLLHEFQTSLDWQLSFSKTPALDLFLKNADIIDYKVSYLYHLAKIRWFGFFAGFRVIAQMLPGHEVRTADTTVTRLDENGDPLDGVDTSSGEPVPVPYKTYASGKKIPMTEALSPTTLREMLGVFLKPLEKKKITLDFRAGVGAWETFVRDGFTVNDDSEGALEIKRMQNSFQVGPQGDLAITGLLREGVSYKLGAMIMYPLYTTADTELEGTSLINAEFEAGLSVKIVSWASLDYSFKALRLPLIVDAWQLQNNLLLSVFFQAFGEE